MKVFTFFCCVGLLSSQGIHANPFFFDTLGEIAAGIAKGVSDTAAGVSNNIPTASEFSLPDLFGNVMKGAVDTATGFGQAAANATSNAFKVGGDVVKGGIDAFTNMGNMIQKGVSDSIKAATNLFNQANDVKNEVLKNAIAAARRPVQRAQAALKDVNNAATKKLIEAMKKLNETIDAASYVNQWAEDQKPKFEYASEEAKKNASKLIADFVKAREEESQDCANNIIKPIQKLSNDSHEFFESMLPTVNKGLDTIQNCMAATPSFSAIRKCATTIRQTSGSMVSIPVKAGALKAKFVGASIDGIINAPCIAETRVKIERGKQELENQLDAILANDSATDASTDASSTDTSSTDASSTDASSTDASSTDASSTDASSTDASSTDASSTVAV